MVNIKYKQKDMEQSTEKWTKQNLWKTSFKKI